MDRIVFLGSGIDDNVANIIAQLLFLDARRIRPARCMYINSPVGRSTPGWRSPTPCSTCAVHTYCRDACLDGAVLLTAGEPGKRYALPNARIMIHQPSGGSQGTASDIEIQAREILDIRQRLNGVLAKHTGQSIGRSPRTWTATGSCPPTAEYGLIDQAISDRLGVARSLPILPH